MDQPLPLAQWVARIGEPLYQCLPPTGYSDKAATWVNTGALLNRMNFAVALTSNKMRGAQVDINSLVGADVARIRNWRSTAIEGEFLAGQVSDTTRATLEKEMTEPRILRREARRSGEASECRLDHGAGSGLAGIPETVDNRLLADGFGFTPFVLPAPRRGFAHVEVTNAGETPALQLVALPL